MAALSIGQANVRFPPVPAVQATELAQPGELLNLAVSRQSAFGANS